MGLEGYYQSVMLNSFGSFECGSYFGRVVCIVIYYGIAVAFSFVLEAAVGAGIFFDSLLNLFEGYAFRVNA